MEKEPVKEEGQNSPEALNPALSNAKEASRIALKWFDEFKAKPVSFIAFVAVIAVLIMGYFIKEGFKWQIARLEKTVVEKDAEITQKEAVIASKDREIYVKDSIHQVRIDATNFNWQGRYDRIDSSYKVILVLYGAKQALQK